MLLIFGGLVLRLMYISYTGVSTRQHDVGHFVKGDIGHAGYMLYLLEKRHMPDFDPRYVNQFYHPPLHHIIGALILAAVRALGFDYLKVGPKVIQCFTVAYSTAFSVLMWRTLKKLGIHGRPLVLTTAIGVFHPSLIILSGSINNDMLAAMLTMAAVFFIVRWSKEQQLGDILGAAFSMGLGMMTKLSAVLIAPAVATVFLMVLIRKKAEWKRLLPQFLLFGGVCAPLGLWFPLKNLILYGVELGYVPSLGDDSGQFIDKAPLERITDWSLKQLSSPFTQWEWYHDDYNEYNPVIALLKNAMFDEDAPFIGSLSLQSFCTALFIAGTVTALVSVFALCVMFSNKEKLPYEMKLMISEIFVVVFGCYILFCFNYPQVCTQNMRYCVPLIFSGSAAIGLLLRRAPNSGKVIKSAANAARMGAFAMCALSVFVYTAQLYWSLPV